MAVAAATLIASCGETVMEFEAGQAWRCPSTEGRPPVDFVISRVDDHADLGVSPRAGEKIYHLSMYVNDDSRFNRVAHSPAGIKALEACDLQTVDGPAENNPQFQSGYEIWRDAFDKGEAGVFTLPVSEAFWSIIGIADEAPARKEKK